ncbi:nucleotide exchange factor GrpE [Anaeromusa acidaminophila]|uniref:nucleotide exchange factor GrpE n=1 Tax=Anaeromusa acidaminophila TaxID=81464 RepID=UPI00037F0C33|nr:nucleotide exchange factor GrpE [Anaeromusa acidaminophila]
MANNHEDLENKENQDVSAQESCQEAETDQTVTVEAVQEEKERLLAEAEDRYKRLYADFDNFRRRSRQEKEELSNVVAQNLILELLPVLDNFERALSSLSEEEAAGIGSGVSMIYRQLFGALEKAGLSVVEAEGKEFDPQYHEAVLRVEDADQAEGTIVQELQKGYSVKGKVIRPSMVKVVG